MFTRLFTIGLLLLVSLVLLISCNDHRIDPNPLGKFRLKTITYNPRGSQMATTAPYTITLTYGDDGQLATYSQSYNSINGGRSNFITTFFRDASGRVIQTGPDLFTTPANSNGKEYDFYSYTSQNQLSSVIRLSYVQTGGHFGSPTLYTKVVSQKANFVYNGSSLLPTSRADTTYLHFPQESTRLESYIFTNGNATQINGLTYSYDDKPNPFYGLVGLNTILLLPSDGKKGSFPYDNSSYFGDVQVKLFNKNNITTNTKNLIYNADGLVIRIEYTNGNYEAFTYEPKP